MKKKNENTNPKRKRKKIIDYDELIETKKAELQELEVKNEEIKKDLFFQDFNYLFDRENYKKYIEAKKIKTTIVEDIKIFILKQIATTETETKIESEVKNE